MTGSRHSQAGITALGFLILAILVGVVGLGVMKVVPMYIKNMRMDTILAGIQKEMSGQGANPQSIRYALAKRFSVEDIHMDADKIQALLARATIEVSPLAYMRGRTLNDSFIILDEAQNTSAEQMKMFLTRLGFNSKMVITGDITQIDLPDGRRSGLISAMEVVQKVEGVAFTYFDERDVVRHQLVQRIVRAYEAHAQAAAQSSEPASANQDNFKFPGAAEAAAAWIGRAVSASRYLTTAPSTVRLSWGRRLASRLAPAAASASVSYETEQRSPAASNQTTYQVPRLRSS